MSNRQNASTAEEGPSFPATLICFTAEHFLFVALLYLLFLQVAQSVKVTPSFVDELRNIVGKSNVSTAEAVREQHGHDESYHQ